MVKGEAPGSFFHSLPRCEPPVDLDTASRRRKSAGILTHADGKNSRGRQSSLVLPGKTRLASSVDLHLSALENRCVRLLNVFAIRCARCRYACLLLVSKRQACSPGFLRSFLFSDRTTTGARSA